MLLWSRLVSLSSPCWPPIRVSPPRIQWNTAVFRPSPLLNLFGIGIFASSFATYPLLSWTMRLGSRLYTLTLVRTAVALHVGCFGLPNTSTTGATGFAPVQLG